MDPREPAKTAAFRVGVSCKEPRFFPGGIGFGDPESVQTHYYLSLLSLLFWPKFARPQAIIDKAMQKGDMPDA